MGIISLFEMRSRFVPSISRASRRDRDLYLLYLVLRDEIENLLYQILNFEKGTRDKKMISRDRARILVANSHEIFRDREFSSMSDCGSLLVLWKECTLLQR